MAQTTGGGGRPRRSPLAISITVGACVGLLIAAIFAVRELATEQREAAIVASVEVATVERGTVRTELVYSGLVQAPQQATLTALAPGPLVSVTAEVGAAVRAGDRLASLASESLPAQVLQAKADLAAAEARRAVILAGARPAEIDSARAALAAAEAKLAQLQQPTAADLAAARAALANARSASAAADIAVENGRALLLGAIANACTSTSIYGIPVPCGGTDLPLSTDITDALTGFLQGRVGDPRNEVGSRAVAALTANGTYRAALASAAAARETVASASARLDALQNPSPADLATQRAQVEAARNALDSKANPYTEADVQAAAAAVARAQAQVAIMEANLAHTGVIAPFDGIIAQRFVDAGANVTPQTPIFLLVARGAEVRVTLRDVDAADIRPGLVVEVSLPGAAKPLAGRVTGIAPVGDQRSHTLDAKITVENPDGSLRPGTLAQVRMITAEKQGVLALPTGAILARDEGTRVFAVIDGRARLRPVSLGAIGRTNAEVASGLQAGDVVIVRGHATLRDGQPVKPAPAP